MRVSVVLRALVALCAVSFGAVACGDDGSDASRVEEVNDGSTTAQPSTTTRLPVTTVPGVRCDGTLSVTAGWPADAGAPVDSPLDAAWSPPLQDGQQVASWPGVLGSGVEVRWPVSPAAGDGDYEDEYEVAGMPVVQANHSFGDSHHSAHVRLGVDAEPEDCNYVSVHAYGDDHETVRRELRTFVEHLQISIE